MLKVDNSQYIWAEKYRPQTIKDMVLPKKIKDEFIHNIEEGRFPHILLSSVNPGTGKTSFVNSVIKDLDADMMFINGSGDAGIDTFRNKVRDFVTSVSIDDSPKIVVIDEADGITNEGQKNLRALIETFSKHTTFIMTCNYKEQLLEPLRNRFMHYDFDSIYAKNKKEIGMKILERLEFILKNENVEYKKEDLGLIIQNLYPSLRKMVIILQQSVVGGKLVLDEKMINLSTKYTEILNLMKDKNFPEVKKRIQDIDEPGSLYSYIFRNLDEWFVPEAQPPVILLCSKYQDQNERARDKAINTAAFTVEVMLSPNIKFL